MFGKKPEPEPVVTMTASELAAFVDARIAERDAKANSVPAPKAPVVERPAIDPFQPPPRDPEFEAALLAIFDAESADTFAPAVDPRDTQPRGQLTKTVAGVYRALNSTPPNKTLQEAFDRWRRHPVTKQPRFGGTGWAPFDFDLERQALEGYIARLDQLRKMPPMAVLIADKLPKGLVDG